MTRYCLAACAALLLGSLAARAQTAPAPAAARAVDLAICLDTSGSMNGLIDAARQKLWAIVNDLALARPAPRLRLALLSFGNNGHRKEDGWVSILVPFTEDLDLVSQRLFALTTNGGEEYVGRVLQAATDRLEWSRSPDALKLIFVAGNESADQDREVPFRDACKKAIGRGVQVNPVYCGPGAGDEATLWREVATLADGHFAAIDHNHGTVAITTPFDTDLQKLGGDLNATYVPLGRKGAEGWQNQFDQDKNAASVNEATAAGRAATKASMLYVCSWDLVDACAQKQVKLEDVKDEDLPEALRKMTVEERRKHLEEMSKRREALKRQIQELEAKRQAHLAAEMKKSALSADQAFDYAVRAAVRAQAAAKGFEFEAKSAGRE